MTGGDAPTGAAVEELLAEQQAYYKARAPEYDDWWGRRGRYALEPGLDARWHDERRQLEQQVDEWLSPRPSRVLELACGTGNWTQHLAARAGAVTAVDGSAETIDI